MVKKDSESPIHSVNWEIRHENFSSDEWDTLLSKAKDAHPLQACFWGEFKRSHGWLPLRYTAGNKNNAVIGMAQVLSKTFFGHHILWVPGNVATDFQNIVNTDGRQKVLDALIETLVTAWNPCYIRFNFAIPHHHDFSFVLGRTCCRPIVRLTGGYSTIIDLDKTQAEFLQSFSSKHRYYVKKALAQDIFWRSGNTPELSSHMAALLGEIVKNKKLNSIYTSQEEIEKLCQLAGGNVVILVGYLDNQPVTACLSLIFGGRVFYQIAATGENGRKINAAYAMILQLLTLLKDRGAKCFDFGGINPQDKNASGVSHFKRGFGGGVIEYLGEWERANPRFIGLLVNAGIYIRGGRM